MRIFESSFAQELPIATAGSFNVKTNITGDFAGPPGEWAASPVLAWFKLTGWKLSSIATDFAANLEGFTLNQARVSPVTGGTITAQGTAGFRRQELLRPDLNFTAQTNLPLDGLAALYGRHPALWP